MSGHVVSGQLVDIHHREIFGADVVIVDGRISEVRRNPDAPLRFLIPGFVDAHVHVESSMLPPAEFARLAVRHGTVATVSDPHEIANVLGVAGVEFMLQDAARTPFKFCFGASPCVPATMFETAGGELDLYAVRALLARDDIGYLSEVMNWPGVLAGDADMLAKIAAAKAVGKPVDGHAPGLRGADAAKYAATGIETDHECFTLEEALDKIVAGMWISIREGSAARNFAALEPLLKSHPDRCMLCCDDTHPNALAKGHIDRIVARAVAGGADLFDVLRCASLHPVEHYRLPVGLLREGDAADFAIVQDLVEFSVIETWIDGECVARDGISLLPFSAVADAPNRFCDRRVSEEMLRPGVSSGTRRVRVIEAKDGELITGEGVAELPETDGALAADPGQGVCKIVVVNRYDSDAPPAIAFVRGFGLKRGAIASSVAHDSHNVVAVGVDDTSLAQAINAVCETKGGVCTVDEGRVVRLPLEIAGLMSTAPGDEVAARYEEIAAAARALGSTLRDPFMTLSFMALLVIPDLKLSDRGLFSGARFEFARLAVD